MHHRHAIRDEDWDRIEDLLPGREGLPGVTAGDNRLFIDAVLWIAKTGAPWRDLPDRFGNWNSIWRRFDRWARKGVWRKVFEQLQDPDLEWLILDSTVIRAHPHAAGARKDPDGTGGQQDQALGRSRGGFGTKIHAAVSGLMLPVRIILTAGQDADVTQAEKLIEDLPIEVVIGDKGYDSDALVGVIEAKGAEAVEVFVAGAGIESLVAILLPPEFDGSVELLRLDEQSVLEDRHLQSPIRRRGRYLRPWHF